MKRFCTTGLCVPEKNYMVDISARIAKIMAIVENGDYFVINRGRQYGKTTTLNELAKALTSQGYQVIQLDFQTISTPNFVSEATFAAAFFALLQKAKAFFGLKMPKNASAFLKKAVDGNPHDASLRLLFSFFDSCFKTTRKRIVLLIDEVDVASDSQAFLDFLAALRALFLQRQANHKVKTFQSVILAEVLDIRHLKAKIRTEEQHKVNSPWNIAVPFDIPMELSADGIRGMLDEYERDHRIGMDTDGLAQYIEDYTGGYPFLVSRICQLLDENLVEKGLLPSLAAAWTRHGVDVAVRELLMEPNTLFQSLKGKLVNFPELKESLRKVLLGGDGVAFNPLEESIIQMTQYGFIRCQNGQAVIANRIFETWLYNAFLFEANERDSRIGREAGYDKSLFISGGKLDMRLVLEHFVQAYHQIFGPLKERFPEKDGRQLFLLYLRPIINGTGNYYIEAQTRDQTRTDVVVDYNGEQFVVELKIWRGASYHERGEQQTREYLDYFGVDTGYMVSFNFNQDKRTGVRQVEINGKTLIKAMV